MRVIQLTQGKVAVVDEADYPSLSLHSWRAHEQKHHRGLASSWYAARTVTVSGHGKSRKRTTIWMHRQILGDPNYEVDHADLNGLNNRRSNLREASKSKNGQNRQKVPKCSSSFKGVSWHDAAGKWRAYINSISLGSFSSELEAALAYNKAASLHFGQFAQLNPI